MNFTVLYGSHRPERRGIHLAQHIVHSLKKRGHDVTLVDAKEIALPVLELRLSDYSEGTEPKKLKDISNTLIESDGFFIVAGEYNSSIQPGLKNLLDHFYKEYAHRPCAFSSYSTSNFGGVRASGHLLQIACALGMLPTPARLIVPNINSVFDENGKLMDETLDQRAEKVFHQFEWYANALKNQHKIGSPV